MIKIKKGDTILEVSNCAYKDIFKKQGYEIITDEKKSKEEKTKVEENIKSNIQEDTDIVSSDKLTEKIDMGVNDNLFPSKEKKKSK